MNKLLIILFLALIIIIFFLLINRTEPFDVVISGKNDDDIALKIDLQDFFDFVENFQVDDLDPRDRNLNASCYREGEIITIRNGIQNILTMLKSIIESNNKDNFYSRFLVTKIGPNLEWSEKYPFRRSNYEELVKNYVGKQFTIVPENPMDRYYPTGGNHSEQQNPMPHTINIHNYYTLENIDVNLLTLKTLLELIQQNDPNVFGHIVRPTEHPVFQEEFIAPLRSVLNSMIAIMGTKMFKEYLHNQKFKPKYRNLIHHPNFETGQFI